MNFIFAIAFLVSTTTFVNFTIAQESIYLDEVRDVISLSELQNDKLAKIESRSSEEIEQLRETLRETQKKLRQQVFERNNAFDAVLLPEQLKVLSEKRRIETIQQAKQNADFLVTFAKYLDAVSSSNALTIYQGLPRGSDAELQKIKDGNKTIEIDGWAFYAQPLPAKSSTLEQLRSSLADYKSFEPFSGGKFCGGFHPDFCVEWKTDGKTYYVQICLGCFEALFITPGGNSKFDFNDDAWESFVHVASSTFNKSGSIIKIQPK